MNRLPIQRAYHKILRTLSSNRPNFIPKAQTLDYAEILRKVDGKSYIFITGPQRTGTTFAAKIIAEDLEYDHIDEQEFGTYHLERLSKLIQSRSRCVIQAPALSHKAHLFHAFDDAAVIWMKRNSRDTLSSEESKNWRNQAHSRETRTYHDSFNISRNASADSYWMKNDIWDRHQSRLHRCNYNLDYESLRIHPKFIHPGNRHWSGLKATKND